MIVYEWDVERLADVGDGVFDIVDHDFSDSCPRHALSVCEQLVLVRDVIGEHGVKDRQWAYVDGGKLPATFSGGAKVPARFHAELAKARP